MRAIDADALMAKLGIGQDCSICKHNDTPYCCWKPDVVDVCEAICDAPTIEPQRTGRWIGKPLGGLCTVRCSCCRNVFLQNDGRWKFCPDCGADMRGEQDENR